MTTVKVPRSTVPRSRVSTPDADAAPLNADGLVHVAGTTGYDYGTMTMPEAITDQCRNAITTIAGVLDQAGSGLDHVVRVRYILPDQSDWEPCWPILSDAFATALPAATVFFAELQNPEMKIEIEVTARVP